MFLEKKHRKISITMDEQNLPLTYKRNVRAGYVRISAS